MKCVLPIAALALIAEPQAGHSKAGSAAQNKELFEKSWILPDIARFEP